MRITHCPSCKQKNEIDYVLLFDNTFEWFICSKCDDVWVKSQYGDWIESNPYQEYIKKLKPLY
jgi:transposase-like protein